jgi:hypothetical protein
MRVWFNGSDFAEFEAMLAFWAGGHDRFGRQFFFIDSASETALGTGDIHDKYVLLLREA